MIQGTSNRRTQKRGRDEITPVITASSSGGIRSPKTKVARKKSTDTFDTNLTHYSQEDTTVAKITNLLDFPDEILLTIFKNLNVLDLVNLSSVNHFLRKLTNEDSLWKELGRKLDLYMEMSVPELTSKHRVIQFVLYQAKILREHFPELLLKAIGTIKLAQLPKLMLSRCSDYIDFLTPHDLAHTPIRWGIDSASRPFLSFQLKLNRNVATSSSASASSSSSSTSEVPDTFSDVFVETLFKRYGAPKSSTWVCAGGYSFLKKAQDGNYTLHPGFLNYVSRLVRSEPCGKFTYNVFEQRLEEETTTDNGKSIVELFPRKP